MDKIEKGEPLAIRFIRKRVSADNFDPGSTNPGTMLLRPTSENVTLFEPDKIHHSIDLSHIGS